MLLTAALSCRPFQGLAFGHFVLGMLSRQG